MDTLAFPTTRLLALSDAHGAPLADFDWYKPLDLLHVLWHGHLTADALVRGAQAGLELAAFRGQLLPRRILTNHRGTSGSWEEAAPWLHYDWLPRAQACGLRQLAHLVSLDHISRLSTSPGQQEFIAALGQVCRVRSFRHLPAAWRWLLRQP